MPAEIRKVTIVGSGNVAWHLGKRIFEKGFEITQVFGRNESTLKEMACELRAEMTTDAAAVRKDADAYIISVSDDAIKTVAGRLDFGKSIVIHTAGSLGLDVFERLAVNYGVLYPLQTFTKSRNIDFNDVPLFIEANKPDVLSVIRNFADKLSPEVHEAGSERRMKLHLAAVFACNFTNHMYALAEKLMKEDGIPFGLLLPLMRETLDKATSLSPHDAQTGPAMRNSKSIMDLHLKMLEKDPAMREIYETVSRSISATAKPKWK